MIASIQLEFEASIVAQQLTVWN